MPAAFACAVAAAPGPAAAKTIVTHSPDSLAPVNAPAHWLPPEPWVYNHWIPYDEGRLYRLLHISRSQLWRQLRDDNRTLAQLAARHGWHSPGRLAAALVAPRARAVGPARGHDGEQPAVGDGAARGDRQSLRTRPAGQHVGDPIPGDPGPKLASR